jgi:hypothetical protein
MNAAEKIARQRLSVLQLAEALGNITAACRQRGMHRSQFYEFKRRFQTHGLEGLKDLPPIHKSHPMTTPEEVVERILELSRPPLLGLCSSQQLSEASRHLRQFPFSCKCWASKPTFDSLCL